MAALALVLAIPFLLWGVQTALLCAARRPVQTRLHAADLPGRFKTLNRVAANVVLASVLLAYPVLRGVAPWDYYAAFFPLADAAHAVFGLGSATLYLTLLYLAWLLSGNVRFERRHRAARLAQRLAAVPFTAVCGALLEELLFRALLLHGLLADFPAAVALPLGALLFAAAHYIRSVKRYWTFGGHLALGALLCIAFWCTGSLWLCTALHAGGILVLMGTRPFVRYIGPPWLVGASIFPYAGAAGIAGLVLLTLNVLWHFGRNV